MKQQHKSRRVNVYVGGKRETTPFLYHGVLRNRGTVQHVLWVGPVMLIIRNRASLDAGRAAAEARKVAR